MARTAVPETKRRPDISAHRVTSIIRRTLAAFGAVVLATICSVHAQVVGPVGDAAVRQQLESIAAAQTKLIDAVQKLQGELDDIKRQITMSRPTTAAPLPSAPVSLARATLRGPQTAHVVVLEFSDFECPFCQTFATGTLPAFMKMFVETGRVLFGFHELPLTSIHPRSLKAAEAAECAAKQGRFWQLHDQLFERRLGLGDQALVEYSRGADLNVPLFQHCLEGETAAKVQGDIQEAQALHVTSTPTFFVGTQTTDGRVAVTRRLTGTQSLDSLKALIEAALQGSK